MGRAALVPVDTGGQQSVDRLRQPRRTRAQAPRPWRLPSLPCPPQLVELLRDHLDEFGAAPDGRLFRGEAGGWLSDSVYGRSWDKARENALTPAEVASPLARRPYDLRHACLSTWLNAGLPATQVAEWAGHSVNVLLRVYAKCILGQDEAAKQRIGAALSLGSDELLG